MKSAASEDLITRQLRAYESFAAMDAWELLRQSKEPRPVAEVAQRLGLSLQAAQAALELAEGAELVQKLPAGKGRRAITYRSAKEQMDVELPEGTADEVRLCTDAWLVAGMRHQEAILQRMVPVNKRVPQHDRYYNFATEFRTSKADFDELMRRVISAIRFLDEILERMKDPAYPADRAFGAHALFLKVAPVRGATKVGPIVKIHTSAARAIARAGRDDAPKSLTRREREIALLLQRGLSRAQVAERLSVSVETVSSHCKQLFKKLGVKRATELGRFSFERAAARATPPSGAAPPT